MSDTKATPNEFLLKEYEALHRKLDILAQEQFMNGRWALAFTGIFWSYLAVARMGWMPGIAYWAPAIFVGLLSIRTVSLLMTVRKIQEYMHSVESYMDLPGVLGWEKMRVKQKTTGIKVLVLFYWLALLGLNIGLAVVYG